jgi:hypothetical protein
MKKSIFSSSNILYHSFLLFLRYFLFKKIKHMPVLFFLIIFFFKKIQISSHAIISTHFGTWITQAIDLRFVVVRIILFCILKKNI